MFSDDEILGMVNQARANCYQASGPPGAVGAPGAVGLTIDPALKEKLKAILLGLFQLIFTQFMTGAPVVQQGLQRGPGPIEIGPTPAPAVPVVPPEPAPDQPQAVDPGTPPNPPVGANYGTPEPPEQP